MNALKQTILPLWIALYLITSTGLMVNVHYCCGEVKDISLATPKSCCGKSGESKGCCHNETKYFKVKDLQLQPDDHDFDTPIAIALPIKFFIHFKEECIAKEQKKYGVKHPPPDEVKVPLYIVNRSILI